jgi:FolB domain-containing protein
MDRIRICDLEVFCRVGVPESERAHPQRLLISVDIEHGFEAAANLDDLARTVDYNAVTQRLLRFGEGRSWKLIESLATEIAGMVLDQFSAASVCVEVKKFVIPQARYVSVQVSRSRN